MALAYDIGGLQTSPGAAIGALRSAPVASINPAQFAPQDATPFRGAFSPGLFQACSDIPVALVKAERWEQTSTPTFLLRGPIYQMLSWSISPTFPERTSVDRYDPVANLPRWDLFRRQDLAQIIAEDPAPFPAPVFAGAWWQQPQVPNWDKARTQFLYPAEMPRPISPFFAERTSVDRYDPLANLPRWEVQRLQHLYPAVAFDPAQFANIVAGWMPLYNLPKWDVARNQFLYPTLVGAVATVWAERTSPDRYSPLDNLPRWDATRRQDLAQVLAYAPLPLSTVPFSGLWSLDYNFIRTVNKQLAADLAYRLPAGSSLGFISESADLQIRPASWAIGYLAIPDSLIVLPPIIIGVYLLAIPLPSTETWITTLWNAVLVARIEPNMIYVSKDPNATTDYTVDWTTALGSDTVVSASFTPPPGIVFTGPLRVSGYYVTARISGGTLYASYLLQFLVTGASGQVYVQNVTVRIVYV